jgi:CO dehydrogenase/acetyl-CoA synthase epsilon subunit
MAVVSAARKPVIIVGEEMRKEYLNMPAQLFIRLIRAFNILNRD